jgi:hypothetical protein
VAKGRNLEIAHAGWLVLEILYKKDVIERHICWTKSRDSDRIGIKGSYLLTAVVEGLSFQFGGSMKEAEGKVHIALKNILHKLRVGLLTPTSTASSTPPPARALSQSLSQSQLSPLDNSALLSPLPLGVGDDDEDLDL